MKPDVAALPSAQRAYKFVGLLRAALWMGLRYFCCHAMNWDVGFKICLILEDVLHRCKTA